MLLEIKRSLKNNFFITILLANILCVVIAFCMLVVLSKMPMSEVDFGLFAGGVYTVYLLLGGFIFSSILIYQFNSDYKDKNILFYKALKYNHITYCLTKLSIACLISILGALFSTLIVCLIYNQFGIYFVVIFLKFVAVLIFYNILSYFLAFIFTNVLAAISINLILWILGLFMSLISPIFAFFAHYSYLSSQYQKFSNFLGCYISYFDGTYYNSVVTVQEMFKLVLEDYLYNIILLIICLLVISILKTRWIKNGI